MPEHPFPIPISRRRFLAAGTSCIAALALAGCSLGRSSATGSDASPARPSGTVVGTPPRSAGRFPQISTTLFVFDTVVTLTASCAPETLDAAAERCRYFESILSRTIATSDVGRINAAAGAPVEVAPETADLITKALGYCEESGGRFDITIGAVTELWDFHAGVVPEAAAIDAALPHVGWQGVSVRGNTVQLADDQAKIDLGGIAKGYIADDLCALFLEAGCDSAYINLGGNVKTVGVKPDGSAWHVGIQDPNDAEGAVVAAVYSQDTSIVTSGLYERRFEKDDAAYWHILDPATGYPVQTDLVSATIISDASLDGDGLTKPLFMIGAAAALEWLDDRAGIEGILVTSAGDIRLSRGCEAELL